MNPYGLTIAVPRGALLDDTLDLLDDLGVDTSEVRTNDRKLRAFNARTGDVLWEFPTNSGIIASPSSFMVDGTQYIAVQSGFGIDSRAMQARFNGLFPGEYPPVPEGGAVWLFAVK